MAGEFHRMIFSVYVLKNGDRKYEACFPYEQALKMPLNIIDCGVLKYSREGGRTGEKDQDWDVIVAKLCWDKVMARLYAPIERMKTGAYKPIPYDIEIRRYGELPTLYISRAVEGS